MTSARSKTTRTLVAYSLMLVGATICTAVAVALAQRSISGWTFVVGLLVGLFAVCVGILGRELTQAEFARSRAETEESLEEVKARERLQGAFHRGSVAALAGVLTALVFLGVYLVKDFAWISGDFDISERRISIICPHLSSGVTKADIIETYPSPLVLIPEFAALGMVAGLAVGFMFDPWRRLVHRWTSKRRALAWLNGRYASRLFFGALWGGLLGAVFNPVFFGKSDGRPFLSVSSAVAAATLSVLLFLLLSHFDKEAEKTDESVYSRFILGVLALAIGVVAVYADASLRISEFAYCHFYEAWDTKRNTLTMSPRVLLAGGLYGMWIGVITMLVASWYRSASAAQSSESRTSET